MNRPALEEIFGAALSRVDPQRMIENCLHLEGDVLFIDSSGESASYNLSDYSRILVLGTGKAGAKMALGLEAVLGERISGGLVAVKYGHTEPLKYIELIEAGHPVPDHRSIEAAQRIADLAGSADKDTLCVILISGGGSSLLTLPYRDAGRVLTLEDIQRTTKLLLDCGAPIREINTLRKHLSGISGGRLCGILAPASGLSLILSDVVGDNPESIASGLTSPDSGTYGQAYNIAKEYGVLESMPKKVREVLEAGRAGAIPDTPKPGDPAFNRIRNMLIGTNALALEAAGKKARELGYNTLVLSSQITGEAGEIAKVFSAVAKDTVKGLGPVDKPACIIAGGETTVTIKGSGLGGRNQEMALSFVREIYEDPGSYAGVSFLSAATDGNDGPTDAAGAFASPDIVSAALKEGMRPNEYLRNNDSYRFFGRAEGLLKTGPTNTNVCDLQILLVD